MTENPNDPLSNGLGGRKYEPWEEQTIHRLALFIRSRDHSLNFYGAPRPRPKDYMLLYVKAAGVAFETAKALYGFKLPRHMEEKSIEEWLNILTGLPIASRDESTYIRFDGIEGDGPNVNGDSFPQQPELIGSEPAQPVTMHIITLLTQHLEGVESIEATITVERPSSDSSETKPEDPC
ncbi:MAG: hypothetical protein MUP21_01320 [Dehalococcoidia bacterium]|nr:hypothetical protein [Dehalococcoidia bacterium]